MSSIFLSFGYEGLSFIENERGGGRRCDLCVVRWSAAAGVVVYGCEEKIFACRSAAA